jgi:hypothetical protein
MAFTVLITWFTTILAGLYMLAVWLIENDVTSRGTRPSRLPVPVVFGHLLLALTGLVLWVTYLVLERRVFAWAAIGVLGGIALLGFTMFARWIPVHREMPNFAVRPAGVRAGVPGGVFEAGAPDRPEPEGEPPSAGALAGEGVPAEGNFPVVVVAAHGLLAVSTLVMAVICALGPPTVLPRGGGPRIPAAGRGRAWRARR